MSISTKIKEYNNQLPEEVTLVAVSKTKPIEDLQEAYNAGQRIFGENKIQEMADKWEQLPKDIKWHMIGHVQRNKVKYMAPFVSLIHAVDSLKLLKEINKQALKNDRTINCLLQVKIAEEDSKFGMAQEDAKALLNVAKISEAGKISEETAQNSLNEPLNNVKVIGLMGMATFTDDQEQVASEFKKLHTFYTSLQPAFPQLKTLSMGMSGDYELAIANGSTMVRLGSSIFGARNY